MTRIFNIIRRAALFSFCVGGVFEIMYLLTAVFPSIKSITRLVAKNTPFSSQLFTLFAPHAGLLAPWLVIWVIWLIPMLLVSLLVESLFRKRASRSTAAAPTSPRKSVGLQIGPRVMLPRNVEQLHVLAVGGTGAGKSQIIRAAALAARADGCPAIIPAVEAALFESMYDPTVDSVLCPYDVRGVQWSPLREIEIAPDAAFLAESLIAPGGSGNSEEWRAYGRQLLTAFFSTAWRNQGSLADVLMMFDLPDEPLARMLRGTAGSVMAREGAERMLSSALATASSAAEALRADIDIAATLTSKSGWSITKWTREQIAKTDRGERCGFLWILLPDRARAAMMPLASAAITIATRTLLSSSENEARRFYLLLDELGSLPAIAAIAESLARGRKYGLRAFIGLQSIAQVQDSKRYGREGAAALLACLSSQVLFRTADAESAEYSSKLIGEKHVTRTQESHSTSNGGGMYGTGGTSSTSTSEHHSIERAVLASEIAGLPNLKAYVRIAGQTSRVMLSDILYRKLPAAQHEYFIPIPQDEGAPAQPASPVPAHAPAQATEQASEQAPSPAQASTPRVPRSEFVHRAIADLNAAGGMPPGTSRADLVRAAVAAARAKDAQAQAPAPVPAPAPAPAPVLVPEVRQSATHHAAKEDFDPFN